MQEKTYKWRFVGSAKTSTLLLFIDIYILIVVNSSGSLTYSERYRADKSLFNSWEKFWCAAIYLTLYITCFKVEDHNLIRTPEHRVLTFLLPSSPKTKLLLIFQKSKSRHNDYPRSQDPGVYGTKYILAKRIVYQKMCCQDLLEEIYCKSSILLLERSLPKK